MASHTTRILSICTRAGGLDLGVGLACPGARTICYVEREAYAAAHLVAAMQQGWLADAPLWTDAGTFAGRDWRGVVDWLVAGIPCQPHSVAGKRTGESDDRNLWPQLRRIISESRPDGIFMENVPGIGRYYHESIRPELSRMGYRVAEGFFSAQQTGAPHIRRRLFVMAATDRRSVPIRCTPMENPQCIRCGGGDYENDTRSQCPFKAQRPSGELADAAGERCSGWGTRNDTPQAGYRPATPTERPSGELSDPRSQGLQGFRRAEQAESPQSLRSLYPPHNADYAKWSQLLDLVPQAEPAFCRMADGLAAGMVDARTARLRLIGNGVVPLVAADAWRVLGGRLNADIR